MIDTKAAAEALGCSAQEFRRAAAVCEERQPWRQWGVPGRGVTYWRSHEIDAIKAILAETKESHNAIQL